MSSTGQSWRPLARQGFGGRAASHWRGVQATNVPLNGITFVAPQMWGVEWWGQVGTITMRKQGGVASFSMSGVTRNSSGVAIGTKNVFCLKQVDGVWTEVARTVSDASGNFKFELMTQGPYWITGYGSGSPDIAGATVNTLQPA